MKINNKLSTALRRMALAVSLAAVSSMASAGIIHVNVDTSNFGVASGFLEMQLGTGNGPLVTALVDNMLGFDASAFIDAFGVTQVPGGYLFSNANVNDLYHAVNFGGQLSFDLTFASAVDPLGLSQTDFMLAAYDETNALVGTTQNGALADFRWTPSATPGIDGELGASISDPAVTFIPEPTDSLLMGAGLGLMALVLRRRTTRPAGLAA
jgi:hypothetical protein